MRRSSLAVVAISLAAAISFAACAAPADVATLDQPIINGTVDDGDPNVVLIFAQVPGQSTGSLCSGEVISPHVVLTAAHCMAPVTVGAGAKFIVFTGTMLPTSGPLPADQTIQVQETHYLPSFSYNPMTGGDADDVGVVILAQPTTIAPLPVNQFALPATAKGGPGRIVGFGITSGTDTQGTTAGTRHQAPTTIFDVQPQTLTLYDAMHSNCEGDSGGPALVMLDGKERIAGITQVGYVNCPTTMASSDTRVDAYVSFIDQYVTMFDPPPVAAGGACTSDSDCGPLSCIAGLCAQPCDPSAMTSMCPSGTECSDVDGKNMCAKPSHHGCSFATAPLGNDGALAFIALALALTAFARRRRA